MEEEITITLKEYQDLLDAQFKLQCLENMGVDNWPGYEDAMEEYYEKENHNL